MLNVVWMEREFDAYKLPRCMCPSKYNRFWDTARYLWKNGILSYPLAFDAPVRGFPSEYRHPLWYGKLEWCRYPMVKKFRRYLYSFWRNSRTWRTHRRTDRRTPGDGNSRDMHSIARQKPHPSFWTAPFLMTLSNLYARFRGHGTIQRQKLANDTR